MVKQGILHDYDLMANAESSAMKENTCVVCGLTPVTYQWSDYSGEAMCTQCGCPYQLKWGGEKRERENQYPYLNLQEDFVSIAQEYWNEKHKFVCYGLMMGPRPGMQEFVEWIKIYHPEWLEKNKEE